LATNRWQRAREMRWKTIAINAAPPAVAHQASEKNSEWRYWGGDGATTHYSPLAQIDRTNVKTLGWPGAGSRKISDRGRRQLEGDAAWLAASSISRLSGGDVVAADAVTGQTLWTFHKDEGSRGRRAPNRLAVRLSLVLTAG
jgi:glucose dehydrogenase